MRNLLKNTLLVLVSVALCTAVAEGIARWMEVADEADIATRLDEIPLAAGVQRAWYFDDPAPLPNRGKAPPEWYELVRRVEASGHTEGTRRADMFKAWNSAFVGDPCSHPYLRAAPGHLFVYDPPDGNPHPRYRFMPNATLPNGLVTNAYGFRGPPVPFVRTPKTVRIAFVGASTTIGAHHFPSSYPEYVGHWLNLWAASKRLDLRFEVLNAGRESIGSTDIETVVRQEVAPLRPDLVIYYEGANQFSLATVVPDLPRPDSRVLPPLPPPQGAGARWLDEAAKHFTLARRLRTLLAATDTPAGVPVDGGEWPKPAYTLVWPAGVDERNPDIGRPDLPVNLPIILGDLDRIRATTESAGGELALASFVWLVKDGMVLNPIRHRLILEYLNRSYAPFRYRDLERLAAFQNRVFANYAAAHHLAFLDVAKLMPRDPDLFVDAIHATQTGVRLQGWVVFQELLPLVEKKLASGAWPKADPGAGMPAVHPAFATPPRELNFTCKVPPA
ncbi:MAG: hypothetical protein Q8N31_03230 [Reyranella sp.]|nr:hypothetical protein [Reyranella sp.]MDP3159002.1 hypothetical protein [Reyranella sp.]